MTTTTVTGPPAGRPTATAAATVTVFYAARPGVGGVTNGSMHPTERTPHDRGQRTPDATGPGSRSRAPPELAALDGQSVTIIGADGSITVATMVIAPGLWGHARRYREGFFDGPDGAA